MRVAQDHAEFRSNTRAATLVYILISALTGFLELGVLALALREGWPVLALPLAALAYQVGAVFVDPLPLNPRTYLLLGVLALFLAFVTRFRTFPLLLVPIALTCISCQGARSLLANTGTTTLVKRLSRISGFVAAGAFTMGAIIPAAGFTLLLVVASILLMHKRSHSRLPSPISAEAIVMVVHQAHYFCYSSLIPLFLYRTTHLPLLALGLLFSLGWLSYSFAPFLLGCFRPIRVFIGGHVFASIILAVLAAYYDHCILLVLLWVLTGFGGGTVFVLRLLERANPVHLGLDTWENVGHILGLVIGLILVYFLNEKAALDAAAILAASTAILLATYAKQRSGLSIRTVVGTKDARLS